MKGIPQGRYTKEFREEAVKLVTEGNMSLPKAARSLLLPPSTLGDWLKAYKAGKLGDVGKTQRPLTEIEMELARTKRELVETRMERDLLKKAAVYFAKESLPGTRWQKRCGFNTR
ncbi:MAG: transposase [Dehalococcoidia bacterium]|nr:transposase [Dehalococcoidia bacterium]